RTRAMRRAHLRRFFGGGPDGPLRNLPKGSVARAKPALETEHRTLSGSVLGCSRSGFVGDQARVFHVRAPALPAQSFGGRFRKGGEAPLRSEKYASRAAVGCRLAAGPFSSL